MHSPTLGSRLRLPSEHLELHSLPGREGRSCGGTPSGSALPTLHPASERESRRSLSRKVLVHYLAIRFRLSVHLDLAEGWLGPSHVYLPVVRARLSGSGTLSPQSQSWVRPYTNP